MAVQATPPANAPAGNGAYTGTDAYGPDEERGLGWVLFAGTLLMMLGTLNFIEGLAAINNSHFFAGNVHYIAGSLNTWGWVVLIIGVVEWAVGTAVFFKSQFARWVAVFILALNAIVQLMMIPAYPFWSLSFFAVDILAIFGLIVHGKRLER